MVATADRPSEQTDGVLRGGEWAQSIQLYHTNVSLVTCKRTYPKLVVILPSTEGILSNLQADSRLFLDTPERW